MTTQELIDYYKNLLIVQYHEQAKAKATIGSVVGEVVASQVYDGVLNSFDISTAVGSQLDILAGIVGLKRTFYGIDLERQYFQLFAYGDDTGNGFSEYGSPVKEWFFERYGNELSGEYTLGDDELRNLIKFVVKLRATDYSLESIDAILYEFFGENLTVFDCGNMRAAYVGLISDESNFFDILRYTGNFPKPSGVKISYVKSDSLSDFFGFQNYGEVEDPTFVGFSDYAAPIDGSFVRYL